MKNKRNRIYLFQIKMYILNVFRLTDIHYFRNYMLYICDYSPHSYFTCCLLALNFFLAAALASGIITAYLL